MKSQRRTKVYRNKSKWPSAALAWQDIEQKTGIPKSVALGNHSATRWQWIITSIYYQKKLANSC